MFVIIDIFTFYGEPCKILQNNPGPVWARASTKMKRIYLLHIAIVVFCLCVAAVLLQSDNSRVSAQTADAERLQLENDKEMAREIARVTNRSEEGLVSKQTKNGIFVDLQERFQNVMIARTEEKGSPSAACITSLDEANGFLGRNLETGERLPRTPVNPRRSAASDHRMTEAEREFYKGLIENAIQQKVLSPESANISIVNNDGAGEGFNDPAAPFVANEGGNSGATRGAQRLNVFLAAAAIWGSFLDSNVTTSVNAQFNGLTCTPTSATLGSAGAGWINRDFPNAPFSGTWYHGALANKLTNTDGSTYEINATFNSNLDNGCFSGSSRFYYGLDGNTAAGTTDLLVVVLHELGHGLGFSSFVNNGGTNSGALFGGFPDAYTRYMYDQSVGLYWYQMSDAQRQTSALNSGNVFWDGPNVKIASSFLTGGRDAATGRVQLHTPGSFSPGSSVSHFSTAAFPNLLMEPSINGGLPIDGDLARQQLRDIGWFRDTTGDVAADTITGVTPNGGGAVIGAVRTINWTNNGSFSRPVRIELSTDGGATYPTIIESSIANTGMYAWTVPNMPTSTARIRVREADFAAPSGVSSADFTITSAPLAGGATVSGRVLDPAGRAVNRATVVLMDGNGLSRTARSNAFGYFIFDDVPVGENYVANVRHKRYRFEQQLVNLTDNFTGLDFVASY